MPQNNRFKGDLFGEKWWNKTFTHLQNSFRTTRGKRSTQFLKRELVICCSAFWKQKCENLKNVSLTFFSSFNPYRPTLSLARGTNRQFYCTRVIIYNKTRQLFYVSVDKHFWVLKWHQFAWYFPFNKQKQSLCTCVIYFVTFLCRPRETTTWNDQIPFLWEREYTTMNASFSSSTWSPLLQCGNLVPW